MAALSYTYTFTNGTAADADKVMQNLNDAKNYINASVIRTDGVNAMAADLNLVGNPSANAHAVRKAYMDGPYVYASAGGAQAFTTNSTATVNFTEVTDTHAAFSGGNLFTAPTAGVYLVSWCAKPDQSKTHLIRMSVLAGGTTYFGPLYVPHDLNGSNEAARIGMAVPVKITAGQTIEARVSISANDNYAMGENLFITWLHG